MANTSAYMYIDGVLKQSFSGLSWTGTNPWVGSMDSVIGNNQNDVYYFFNGKIAVARFYKNKALTALEVQQNFNALRGRFGI